LGAAWYGGGGVALLILAGTLLVSPASWGADMTPAPDGAGVQVPLRSVLAGLLTLGLVEVWRAIRRRTKPAEPVRRHVAGQDHLLFQANPQPMWVYDLQTL